ncbi:SGNH/GDSL hydrolase family protein [Arcticibacter sp.]|jgi:lysophospholipase L1-like esterase|uniref:SGNH/GDSL hydrolase family protein n=1 Tax=Arcticibacter sp. TaxID=1872630 RepID=UPI0038909093
MKAFYQLSINGILLLALFIAADRGLGKLIEHYFFTEKQGDSAVTTHGVLHTREDILIFGSSRASHHYIPELIGQQTGLSCYNLGRDGMKMKYYETLLKAVLSHHIPKVVILDLNLNDFEDEDDEGQRLTTVFMPYINKNREIHDLIYTESKKEYSLANISALYRVNSLPLSILQHHLEIGQKQFNGYEPLVGAMPKISRARRIDNKRYKESAAKLVAFENFVKETQSRKIKLHVLISPGMKIYKHNALKTADSILNKYNLKANNYLELFKPDAYDMFYDGAHLNEDGAKAFTTTIVAAHLL